MSWHMVLVQALLQAPSQAQPLPAAKAISLLAMHDTQAGTACGTMQTNNFQPNCSHLHTILQQNTVCLVASRNLW